MKLQIQMLLGYVVKKERIYDVRIDYFGQTPFPTSIQSDFKDAAFFGIVFWVEANPKCYESVPQDPFVATLIATNNFACKIMSNKLKELPNFIRLYIEKLKDDSRIDILKIKKIGVDLLGLGHTQNQTTPYFADL